MFTHIVLFKLKDPTAENTAALCAKLQSLTEHVPLIRQLEVGADVVRSERSCDVGLIVRLDSADDLEAYQTHPYHQEVLTYVRSVITEVKAVDF